MPASQRYLFVCQNRPIDILLLDDALPSSEADRQALEHAEVLVRQHLEPVFVFHVPPGDVPMRDVGAAGMEYAERDRLEEVVGVVYRLEDRITLRIGGYNRLIRLSNPPAWLRNPDTVFTATARYGPKWDYLVILTHYRSLYHLKAGDPLQYELDEQIVSIRYTGDMADADQRAIERAKQLTTNRSGAITVAHRIDAGRIRLLTVVEDGQETPPLSDKPHPMRYIGRPWWNTGPDPGLAPHCRSQS